MQSVSQCSQYYPYAGKTQPCSGNVHELTVKTEAIATPYEDIIVCEAHIQSFKKLGQREGFLFAIVGDNIIGEIAHSEEGQSPKKEQR